MSKIYSDSHSKKCFTFEPSKDLGKNNVILLKTTYKMTDRPTLIQNVNFHQDLENMFLFHRLW